jgi:hypothetical protein
MTLQNVSGMILDAVSLGVVFGLRQASRLSVCISLTRCARRDSILKFMFRIGSIQVRLVRIAAPSRRANTG